MQYFKNWTNKAVFFYILHFFTSETKNTFNIIDLVKACIADPLQGSALALNLNT